MWDFHQLWKFRSNVQKRWLLHTLLQRNLGICCDFKTFFWNWVFKDYPYKNNYPLNFLDSCIKSFLNKLYTPKVMVLMYLKCTSNVPKRNVFVKLQFLGSTSFQIRKKLHKLFSDKLTSCKIKIVFMSPVRVKNFFTFKDKLPKMLHSRLTRYYL